MERKYIYDELIKLMMDGARSIKKYESVPRSYGTEDILYAEECHTIEMIGENETISITEMARAMEKTKSAISQIVDRLVKKGMLEKHPHPDNDRGLILKLTPRGRLVYEYHGEFDRKQYGKLFRNLTRFSDEELTAYTEIQKEINLWLNQKE